MSLIQKALPVLLAVWVHSIFYLNKEIRLFQIENEQVIYAFHFFAPCDTVLFLPYENVVHSLFTLNKISCSF